MSKINTEDEYFDIQELLGYGYDDIFYLFARIEKITQTLNHFDETARILGAIKVMEDEYNSFYDKLKQYREANNLD